MSGTPVQDRSRGAPPVPPEPIPGIESTTRTRMNDPSHTDEDLEALRQAFIEHALQEMRLDDGRGAAASG